MKIHTKTLLLSILSLIAVSSCSKFYVNETESESQIIPVAIKSPDTDFSGFRTYAIADSIIYVDNETKYRTENAFTHTITESIKEEMTRLGYAETTSSPDLLIDVCYVRANDRNALHDYTFYWNWSWWRKDISRNIFTHIPFALPGYCNTYYTGNLLIEMADLTVSSEKIPVVWHALMRSFDDREYKEEQVKATLYECFTMLPPIND